MKSIEERKLALISRIHQLKRELDNLKPQDYRWPQLSARTDRSGYVVPNEFDSKLQ